MEDAEQIIAPLFGSSVSHGFPGGPGKSILSEAKRNHQYDISQSLNELKELAVLVSNGGDWHGFMEKSLELNMSAEEARQFIRWSLYPHISASELRKEYSYLTPDQSRKLFHQIWEQDDATLGKEYGQ
jgi:hypothetical protein